MFTLSYVWTFCEAAPASVFQEGTPDSECLAVEVGVIPGRESTLLSSLPLEKKAVQASDVDMAGASDRV